MNRSETDLLRGIRSLHLKEGKPLPTGHRLALVLLRSVEARNAHRAGPDGNGKHFHYCMGTLAGDLGLGKRQTIRIVRDLEDATLIQVDRTPSKTKGKGVPAANRITLEPLWTLLEAIEGEAGAKEARAKQVKAVKKTTPKAKPARDAQPPSLKLLSILSPQTIEPEPAASVPVDGVESPAKRTEPAKAPEVVDLLAGFRRQVSESEPQPVPMPPHHFDLHDRYDKRQKARVNELLQPYIAQGCEIPWGAIEDQVGEPAYAAGSTPDTPVDIPVPPHPSEPNKVRPPTLQLPRSLAEEFAELPDDQKCWFFCETIEMNVYDHNPSRALRARLDRIQERV